MFCETDGMGWDGMGLDGEWGNMLINRGRILITKVYYFFHIHLNSLQAYLN